MPAYPWQATLWEQFVSLRDRGALPHAILLCAENGLGARKLARGMANYVLCSQPSHAQACGNCKACLLLKAGSHPDFKSLEPEEKSTQIRIDQIRELNAFLAQTAQQAAWKIVVLEPAQAMNVNAANALLKNLEEPAAQTLFILIAEHGNKVLPTIRSRCRQFQLPAPSRELALDWLSGQGVKGAETLVDYLGPYPLLALEWYQHDSLAERQAIQQDIEKLLGHQSTASAMSKRWSALEPPTLFSELLRWAESEIRRASLANASRKYVTFMFQFCDRLRQKCALLGSSANINAALLIDEAIFDLLGLARIRPKLGTSGVDRHDNID